MMKKNLDYTLFYQNENEMARVFGAEHLCAFKRPEFKPESESDREFFELLPSYGTLASFVLKSENHTAPTTNTIHAITFFFKSAYNLPYPERITHETLLTQSMSEILEHQGLTRLQKAGMRNEPRRVNSGWLKGRYYCYYADYDLALKKTEVKGCILNITESKDYSYEAVMISGFSRKGCMDEAMEEIFADEVLRKKTSWEEYRAYKEKQKYNLDKNLFYWTGNIEYEKDFVKGDFYRSHFYRKQELLFFLFAVEQSSYGSCNGAIGSQIISPDGNDEIKSTKFLVSRFSLKWDVVEEFFRDRKEYTFLNKSDDKAFLKLIQLAETAEHDTERQERK